jgi:tetratricopeptide (TPR) repeat protein
MSPGSLHGFDLSAAVRLKQGSFEEAARFCQKILEMSSMGTSLLAKVAAYRLAFILWVKKRRNEAARLFEIQVKQHQEALKRGDQSWVPRFLLASINAVQGQKETACTWLKKAVETGFRDSSYFDLYSDWDDLKDFDEFQEIYGQLKNDLEKMRRRAEAMNEQYLSRPRKTNISQHSESNSDHGRVDQGKE